MRYYKKKEDVYLSINKIIKNEYSKNKIKQKSADKID